MAVSNAPARINEVQRRPVVIVERTPDCIVVVNHDRIRDLQLLEGTTDVVDVMLECELGCVHAEHDEFPAVLLCPSANVRKCAQPVDACVRAELNEHDFARETVWR